MSRLSNIINKTFYESRIFLFVSSFPWSQRPWHDYTLTFKEFAYLKFLPLCVVWRVGVCYMPGGGWGGCDSPHDWLMATHGAACPKKVSKGYVSQASVSSTFSLKRFFFFFFLYRTLGVPRNKDIISIFSERHLGYHAQHHEE